MALQNHSGTEWKLKFENWFDKSDFIYTSIFIWLAWNPKINWSGVQNVNQYISSIYLIVWKYSTAHHF